jgi:peptide/nickel transport system substrate-binding protein
MLTTRSWRARATAVSAGLAAMLAATSCGSPPAPPKTIATFAEAPNLVPNYIFPLTRNQFFNVQNLAQFQMLMYRPLYWFGDGGRVHLNNQLSLAEQPQYAADGKSVTITLKHYVWSDGHPVTTRDITFWHNLVMANKNNWGGYSAGQYPDNITGVTVNSDTSITFHLNQAYGQTYFTYNELSQITPIPQHVWDKRSAAEAVGDYDTTPAGAQAVYKFLDAEATKVVTYATNPLWAVVDGPWKLKQMDIAGNVTMVPNPMYSGPVKPKLTEFHEVPFTKDTAEFDALRTGTGGANAIDYGYLPLQLAGQKDQVTSRGYTLQPWADWQVTYFLENYTNPASGPIFQQAYFRQAMQSLVDQSGIIKNAFSGYAYPTYGPVPLKPQSDFTDQAEQTNPLPFDPAKATSLLQSHGWTVNAGGISTCTSPGTAANQCGAGVTAGAQAAFHLEYISGFPWIDTEMNELKSDFSKAGIQLNLSTNSQSNVLGTALPCTPGKPCTWDMEYWVTGWVFFPDYYPTGDLTFGSASLANGGGYADPQADELITATQTGSNVSAIYAYQDYLAKTPPVVWMPTQYAQLSMINTQLRGAQPQDPLMTIYPENWSWS